MDNLEEALASVMESLKENSVAPENQEKINKNMEAISGIVSTVKLAYEDGIGWDDITVIGELVGPIMALAAGFDDFKGLSRRKFVIEVVWLIYKTIDTYPDGNRNNINVPYLVGPFESKFERVVVCFAAGMAVDALYKRMKKEGEV